MTARYELWMRTRPSRAWRITGPGVDFHGAGRRGYLTLPPLAICDAQDEVVARLGGNRRIGPGRHLLTSRDGSTIAVFETKRIASVIELRPTRVLGPDGDERCTLIPAEAAAENAAGFATAVLGDDGHLVSRAGVTIGRLGFPPQDLSGYRLWRRTVQLGREARDRLRGDETEQQTGLLTLDTPLEPSLCAALLLYERFVISPARTPES